MNQPDPAALDPRARRLLAMIALGAPRHGRPVTIEERRASFAKLMRFSGVPEAAVETRDLIVPGRGGSIPIRVHSPIGLDGPAPGLVYFHGGGLVAGSLETHSPLCAAIANAASCRVVAVGYRLAPEHPFPAAILDALAATRWCGREADQLGLRREAIAVGGDSGGATLATIVCQIMGRRGGLKAQVLLCPVLDHDGTHESRETFGSGFLLDAATMAADLAHYATTRPLADPRISPLLARDLRGMPTTVIHTAAFDPLVDEGDAYAAKLAAAGTPVVHRRHETLTHHFYALGSMVPAAADALKTIAADIRRVLA